LRRRCLILIFLLLLLLLLLLIPALLLVLLVTLLLLQPSGVVVLAQALRVVVALVYAIKARLAGRGAVPVLAAALVERRSLADCL